MRRWHAPPAPRDRPGCRLYFALHVAGSVPLTALLVRLRQSVLVKLAFIAFLVLVLLIPMGMVESVIHERQAQRLAAGANIMQSWGREQIVGGPLLRVPYRVPERSDEGAVTGWRNERLFVLPSALAIEGTMEPEYRNRGIHRVPVYTARLALSARFSALDLEPLLPLDAVIAWDRVAMALAITDARAIKSPVSLSGSACASTRAPPFTSRGCGPPSTPCCSSASASWCC